MKPARVPVRSFAARSARELGLALLRVDALRRPPPQPAGPRLRIVACSPTYIPTTRRGAEVTLHSVLAELAARGHDVRVLVGPTGAPGVVDGVTILRERDGRATVSHGEWADVVIGQLAARWDAAALATRARRPFVFFAHIGNVARMTQFGRPDLTVFNSETVRRQQPWVDRSLVLHPPIREVDYLTSRGDALTLVNLTQPKGVDLFFALAQRLPKSSFLGVKGRDAVEATRSIPSNVTVVDHIDDMRNVYGRTRVLLLPSVYESYGRVALEAAVSGIPTIAHSSEGVREAMGDAALWADRDDVDAWERLIASLDDPDEYRARSHAARQRFSSLTPLEELDALERALRALATQALV